MPTKLGIRAKLVPRESTEWGPWPEGVNAVRPGTVRGRKRRSRRGSIGKSNQKIQTECGNRVGNRVGKSELRRALGESKGR